MQAPFDVFLNAGLYFACFVSYFRWRRGSQNANINIIKLDIFTPQISHLNLFSVISRFRPRGYKHLRSVSNLHWVQTRSLGLSSELRFLTGVWAWCLRRSSSFFGNLVLHVSHLNILRSPCSVHLYLKMVSRSGNNDRGLHVVFHGVHVNICFSALFHKFRKKGHGLKSGPCVPK